MEASSVAGSGAGGAAIATLPSRARGCGLRPVPALPGAVTRLRAAPGDTWVPSRGGHLLPCAFFR